jgi:hypothetical protein
MAFPPRPRSARNEPNFAPRPVAPRDAVPMRPVAATRAPQIKPSANDPGFEHQPPRLATEQRYGVEPKPLTLTAADRIVVSSELTSKGEKRERSFFRVFGFLILLALAVVGALTLYHVISPYLP